MAQAGEKITPHTIPGFIVGTTTEITDSATFNSSTAVEMMNVTASLEEGNQYKIVFTGSFESTAGSTVMHIAIHQDSIGGIRLKKAYLTTATANVTMPLHQEVVYTATATGLKTFAIAGNRSSGTGTCKMSAAADNPAIAIVEYFQ